MSLTRTPYIVLFVILIAISTITVYAHSPELDLTVLTNSGTAVIDGTMSPGEWDNAKSKTFDMNLPGTTATVPATLFVMADDTNLYFVLQYQRAVLDANNSYGISFDNAHNGLRNDGDDSLFASSSFTFSDRFADGVTNLTDDLFGGTKDGSAARTLAGGFITHEISHPFNSADNSHDISMLVGDTVGFSVTTILGSGTPDDQTDFPSQDSSGFGDLTLSQACNISTIADSLIQSSCVVPTTISAGGDVTVQSGAVMTIPSDVTLDIDFVNNFLKIEFGSGVLIKAGGTIT